MEDKLRGKVMECPYHGDDYEACIEYSGTAPCSMGEELAQLQANAYERGYIDGWDHRPGTKPDDGNYTACGRRLARRLAAIRYEHAKGGSE